MALTLARVVSFVALAGTILPAVLLLAGRIDAASMKAWMLLATVAWFVATPLWMERDDSTQAPPPPSPPR